MIHSLHFDRPLWPTSWSYNWRKSWKRTFVECLSLAYHSSHCQCTRLLTSSGKYVPYILSPPLCYFYRSTNREHKTVLRVGTSQGQYLPSSSSIFTHYTFVRWKSEDFLRQIRKYLPYIWTESCSCIIVTNIQIQPAFRFCQSINFMSLYNSQILYTLPDTSTFIVKSNQRSIHSLCISLLIRVV